MSNHPLALALIAACTSAPALPEAGLAPPTPVTTVTIGPAAAATTGDAVLTGNHIRMFSDAAEASYPLLVPVGCSIVQWSIRVHRTAATPAARALLLVNEDGAKNELDDPVALVSGTQTVQRSVAARVMAERDYEILVQRDAGSSADYLFWAAITYVCP